MYLKLDLSVYRMSCMYPSTEGFGTEIVKSLESFSIGPKKLSDKEIVHLFHEERSLCTLKIFIF